MFLLTWSMFYMYVTFSLSIEWTKRSPATIKTNVPPWMTTVSAPLNIPVLLTWGKIVFGSRSAGWRLKEVVILFQFSDEPQGRERRLGFLWLGDDRLALSPGLRGRSCCNDPGDVGLRRGQTMFSCDVDRGIPRLSLIIRWGGGFSCLDGGRGGFALKAVLK